MADEATGGDRRLTLHEAAARHGAYRWVERRLYELTGRWSGAPLVPPHVRVHLFEASAQHAWHAQLWGDRLPVLAGTDAETWTRPLGAVLEPLLDALEEAGPRAADAGVDGERGGAGGGAGDPPVVRGIAALYRVVLPGLLASYARHRFALGEVADRPAIRALALVVRDEEDQLAAGARLLADMDPHGTADVAAVQAAVSDVPAAVDVHAAVAGPAGGPAGRARDLVPWPPAFPP